MDRTDKIGIENYSSVKIHFIFILERRRAIFVHWVRVQTEERASNKQGLYAFYCKY